MSDTNSTPDAAGAENGGASFDETGGVLDALGSEDDGRNSGAGPDEIGNPLRPGGQDGPVGDVADGEEPHLGPDDDAAETDADARNP